MKAYEFPRGYSWDGDVGVMQMKVAGQCRKNTRLNVMINLKKFESTESRIYKTGDKKIDAVEKLQCSKVFVEWQFDKHYYKINMLLL